MTDFNIGDHVRITTDHVTGFQRNHALNNAEGIVTEFDRMGSHDPFPAVRVRIITGDNTGGQNEWWFHPTDLEPATYPTDEQVAEVAQRTVELERSLRGAIDAHAERESRQG